MSVGGFVDKRDDRFFRSSVDGSRSRIQQRAAAREEAGAWDEDLETSVYGEQSWILPGKGDSGDDCGTWWPERFCENADEAHIQMGMHQCGNRSCERCWGKWSRDRATAICARLGAARYDAPEGEKRAIHGLVSAPEGSIQTVQEVYDMIGDAYDLAKEKGVKGGVAIPHLYRIPDDIKDLIELERERDEFEGGDWKWVREHERHWRDLTYWSPHVHIIGWVGSNDVQPGDDDADDGWVWRNLRSLKPFTLNDPEGYEDQVGLAMYLLSHATFEEDARRQVVRWFGDLYPGGFNPEEALSPGAWEAIKRKSEEAIGGEYDDTEASEEDEDEECEHEGCGHATHPIWEARDYLEQRGKQLSEESFNQINTAYMWATGEIQPPPGLKRPQREEQAWDAMRAML